MDLYERLGWMLLGGVIGLFAGYLLRYLQELKEELDEVDGIVKRKLSDRKDDDEGFINNQTVKDVMLLVVLIIVVGAAWQSLAVSKRVTATQDEVHGLTECSQEYLTKTVRALNERTEFTEEQARANVVLQKAQADFFSLIIRKPPESEAVQSDAAQDYLQALTKFINISSKSQDKAEQFPYPTDEELVYCYNGNEGTS